MAIDDAALAARFASGDPDTIRVLYQRYGRLVYAVAYRVLGEAGLAEDATQQAFVQAWRAAGSFDPTRPLSAWLASIARRAAIDVYRRERRHRGVEDVDPADPALVTAPPSIEQISDVWEVRQALDRLPDQDRELLALQHYAELTHTEIAGHLAIPIGTVKSRSFRAHRRLAALLGHLRPRDADPHDADPDDADPRDADPHDADPHDADPHDADPHDADPHDADPHDADPHDADPHDAEPRAFGHTDTDEQGALDGQ